MLLLNITRFLTVIFVTWILICDVNAKECESGSTLGWNFGETVRYRYKAKINVVCDKSHWAPGTTFLGLEIIEYPKPAVQIYSRPYELAFKAIKKGNYSIKYKLNMIDKYGKEQFVIFAIDLDVVDENW